MFQDKKYRSDQSLGSIWLQVGVTWALTLFETFILVSLPLLIGYPIDGLLAGDWSPFFWLCGAMVILIVVSVGRRLYDTRAYGRMRVELGAAVVEKSQNIPVSTTNARLAMSRELITFLESEAPIVIIALLQIIVSMAILYSFHGLLAATAGGATLLALAIYGIASGRFFRLNGNLNAQAEEQVSVLEGGVREAIVYGLIFIVLLSMLSTNLWFATLQSLTRISEITQRINQLSDHRENGVG